jgi:tRNA(Glu) U13 pseudouridine synthase TruD
MPELKSEGTKRKGFIKPADFNVEEVDDNLEVSFFLEKGSYATILLRYLFGVSYE